MYFQHIINLKRRKAPHRTKKHPQIDSAHRLRDSGRRSVGKMYFSEFACNLPKIGRYMHRKMQIAAQLPLFGFFLCRRGREWSIVDRCASVCARKSGRYYANLAFFWSDASSNSWLGKSNVKIHIFGVRKSTRQFYFRVQRPKTTRKVKEKVWWRTIRSAENASSVRPYVAIFHSRAHCSPDSD